MRNSFCSCCGTRYQPDAVWPRVCAGCGETTWRNPTPVAVALLPVAEADGGHGLVVVRRDIEPGRGELALPGGFMEVGEVWQEATVRELREETGIVAAAADVRLFDVHSGNDGGVLLVFGLLPERPRADLPPVTATDETTEWLVVTSPRRLVFPTHTEALAAYFARRDARVPAAAS
ncbi:ADP-ribose pyrophosphatase [Frankia sp. EI5c]|uniref:NUDIX domain-containing protein n=1 Tax=Frankia sp. EI5c TaxID=683316 RepID=UPI0007C2269C|nr:NUDIX domain-containing protein [Frankia sp. EI5c]OAA27523.1 ADP-ribose pyrophosphatase [Frankia sp. EI5c]